MAPQYHLTLEKEKERYLKHNNDVDDPRYQEFVQPIVQEVLNNFKKEQIGLDFGCGTGPVICKLLEDRGYPVMKFDPFFHNQPNVLQKQYDFIICCEVAEHFRDPLKEFKLLKSLLKPKGILFVLTERYSKDFDFSKWHYKSDPTHIFFYQKRTFEWIRESLGFNSLEIKNRLAILLSSSQ